MKKINNIGIVGFGDFSWFMSKHLNKYCNIFVYSRRDVKEKAIEVGAIQKSLEEVCACDIVIFSVVVQHMDEVVKKCSSLIKKGTIVLDVSSVKVKPTNIMKKYLSHTEIIPTHPLFGLKSGENGIEGLNMVICDIGSKYTPYLVNFCRDKLKLNVIEKSPEEHDKEMAYAQGLSHFIGEILTKMKIQDLEQKTLMYQKLLDIVDIVSVDSPELFQTLEIENPYAEEVRKKFIEEAEKIHNNLDSYSY